MTIKAKIQQRIKRAKHYVFMRDDFNDIANYDQIGRVLRNLVQKGELLKVGYGIYTKARKNQIMCFKFYGCISISTNTTPPATHPPTWSNSSVTCGFVSLPIVLAVGLLRGQVPVYLCRRRH